MYDPIVGRWLEEDPEGFDAGDANLYRYVDNRQTKDVDPSGFETIRYRVPQPGQSITEIARVMLGNSNRWPEIYRLNHTIQIQQLIPPGTIVIVEITNPPVSPAPNLGGAPPILPDNQIPLLSRPVAIPTSPQPSRQSAPPVISEIVQPTTPPRPNPAGRRPPIGTPTPLPSTNAMPPSAAGPPYIVNPGPFTPGQPSNGCPLTQPPNSQTPTQPNLPFPYNGSPWYPWGQPHAITIPLRQFNLIVGPNLAETPSGLLAPGQPQELGGGIILQWVFPGPPFRTPPPGPRPQY